MKETLTIYQVSHPYMMTESFSLLGDKYLHALPFSLKFVDKMEEADVIIWDGVITQKNQALLETILEEMKKTKVLLLLNDSMTLLKNHPVCKMFEPINLNYVELTGWNTLPEEFLGALELCHQKLRNV